MTSRRKVDLAPVGEGKSDFFKGKSDFSEPSSVYKDKRLDELMPLLIEMITKLLNASGMSRYRTDFVNKVKEILKE